MLVSLYEIEVTALRALRGAGEPWGLAEEGGHAARWLARRQLPWLAPVLALAELPAGVASAATPGPEGRLAPAVRQGLVCPLRLGCALADGVTALPAGPAPLRAERLAAPALLAAMLARLAGRRGIGLRVSWPGLEPSEPLAWPAGGGAHPPQILALTEVDWLTIEPVPAPGGGPAAEPPMARHGYAVEPAQWRKLLALAARTYVPESAASRLKGAGAGLSDND